MSNVSQLDYPNWMDTSPEGIRALRGTRSVAELAHRLGVSPLTIYRWELPESAAQSRRPRRASRQRLAALVDQQRVLEHPPEPDPALLTLLDDDVGSGRWEPLRRRALTAMTRGESSALTQLAFATTTLLGRGDSQGALAALAPALQRVGEGRESSGVSARICALAALIHAAPDGRTFDLSRAREAAAKTTTYPGAGPDCVAMAAVAELQAAWFGADASVFEWTLSRRTAALAGARSPLVRAMALEMRATWSYMEGRPGEAGQRFSLVAEEARALGFGLLEARALCMRALIDLEGAVPPARVLATIHRARRAHAEAQLDRGHIDLLLAGVEAEATMRGGSASEASDICREADVIAEEIHWLPIETLLCRTRMTFDVGGIEGVRQLLDWFEARSDWPGHSESILVFLRALDASFQPDMARAIHGMREAAEGCDRSRPWLERMARLLVFAMATYSHPEQAAAAARRLERCLERSPSAWTRGLFAHLQGVMATQLGDYALAREQLQTGLATLEMAGDVYETARCRRALAIAAWIRRAPEAQALLEETEAELKRLGIVPAPAQRPENVQRLERGQQEPLDRPPLPLIVPVQRLAMRGLPSELLRRELVSMAGDLSGTTVSLTDQTTGTLLARLGEDRSPEGFSLEIADGMGGQYRLGVTGTPDGETRSLLRALSAVAGMALERAALYETPRQTAPSESLEIPDGFIAVSAASRALLADLGRLKRSMATVLLTGESGSGKEVAARALHTLSSRSEGPFVAFNCAVVPRELFDAQLFGYRRGAFTGARDSRPGMIRTADGGTLFLDEIGDLPLEVQAKLLRFLENGEVQPLGEDRPLKVNVRVVAATHRDLPAMVAERTFREDLLYRLRVIPLHLPPLRERREDILPLARHFLSQLTDGAVRLAPDAAAALLAHPWPGNIRELRNLLERSAVFVEGGMLRATELRFDGLPTGGRASLRQRQPDDRIVTPDDLERVAGLERPRL
ncbi:MAG: hypothetical protein ACI8RZ_001491 [Myxococcota bacterium]